VLALSAAFLRQDVDAVHPVEEAERHVGLDGGGEVLEVGLGELRELARSVMGMAMLAGMEEGERGAMIERLRRDSPAEDRPRLDARCQIPTPTQ
jgi:hypothetical protein